MEVGIADRWRERDWGNRGERRREGKIEEGMTISRELSVDITEEEERWRLRKTLRIRASSISGFTCRALFLCLFMLLSSHPVQGIRREHSEEALLETARMRRQLKQLEVGTTTISLACAATRFPDACLAAFRREPRAATAVPQELVGIAISIAHNYAVAAITDGATLASLVPSAGNVNLTAVSKQCTEVLDLAAFHLQNSENAFNGNLLKDIQAWISGALTFEFDCYYSLSAINTPLTFVPQMLGRLNVSAELISNALAMTDALVNYGPNAASWKPPPVSRQEQLAELAAEYPHSYPEWLNEDDRNLLNGQMDIPPSITISLGSALSSIQQAVDYAPAWSQARYVIYIKAGIYNQIVRVPKNKPNLMFIGDGINQTIITGSMNDAQVGMTTWLTATVGVDGAGFIARGITFQNTGGPEVHQAVALRLDSDQSALQSCSIVAFQDTLYTHALRQFYKDCTIEGTVDFIFGNSAAFFQNCNIVVRPGRPTAITSTLTAQGRVDPGQTTGFVFQGCSVFGTPEYEALFLSNQTGHLAYLGRPWKTYSRTIFISTYLDQIIEPVGWLPWNGTFALDTLLDAEYGSYGPGANNLAGRVYWSSQFSSQQAQAFSVDNFIQGSLWLPQTGVPFIP